MDLSKSPTNILDSIRRLNIRSFCYNDSPPHLRNTKADKNKNGEKPVSKVRQSTIPAKSDSTSIIECKQLHSNIMRKLATININLSTNDVNNLYSDILTDTIKKSTNEGRPINISDFISRCEDEADDVNDSYRSLVTSTKLEEMISYIHELAKLSLSDTTSNNDTVPTNITDSSHAKLKVRSFLEDHVDDLLRRRNDVLLVAKAKNIIQKVNSGHMSYCPDTAKLLDLCTDLKNLRADIGLVYLQSFRAQNKYLLDDSFFSNSLPKSFEANASASILDYGYDIYSKTCSAKARYLLQGGADEIYNYVNSTEMKNERKLLLNKLELNPKTRNFTKEDEKRLVYLSCLHCHSVLFKDMSSQARSGGILEGIWSLLFARQKTSEKQYYTNLPDYMDKDNVIKNGEDLVCVQALRYLYRKYSILPFHEKEGKIYFRAPLKNFNTMLLPLSYGLLNGALHELCGVLTHDTAKLYVQMMFNATEYSFSQYFLDIKSKVRSNFKLFLDVTKVAAVIASSPDGDVSSIESKILNGEFWVDEETERKTIDDDMNVLPTFLYTWINGQLKTFSSFQRKLVSNLNTYNYDERLHYSVNTTEFLRWYEMTIHVLSNSGIYHKTSLLLEFVKSAQSTLITNVPEIKPIGYFFSHQNTRYPYFYDVDDLIRKNFILFSTLNVFRDKYIAPWLALLPSMSMEKEFVNALTSRSVGVKVDDVTLNKMFRSVSNSRLFNFLLNLSNYYIIDKLRDMVSEPSVCTWRYQIDRRARLVYMVSNPNQLAAAVMFALNNYIKNDIKTIGTGKQRGNITDAHLQLYSTGNVHTVKNSSDVKGMDAATLTSISEILLKVMCTEFANLNTKPYFCFNTKEYQTIFHKGIDSGAIVDKQISSVSIMLAYILHHRRPTKYSFFDEAFGVIKTMASDSFESGMLNTSEQHTTFGDCLETALLEYYNRNVSNVLNILSKRTLIFGDDKFEEIIGNKDSIISWLRFVRAEYRKLNYVVETEASYFYGTFLQQKALFGVMVPQPARTSVFCDERSKTQSRDPFSRIKILLDVSRQYAQRTWCPDNIAPFCRSLWLYVRGWTIRIMGTEVELKYIMNKIFSQWFRVADNRRRLYVTLPYLLISSSPISFPLPVIQWPRANNSGLEYIPIRSKYDINIRQLMQQSICINDPSNYVVLETAITSPGGDVNALLINCVLNKYYVFGQKLKYFPDSESDKMVQVSTKAYKYGFDPIDGIDWIARHELGITISEWLLSYSRIRRLTSERMHDFGELEINMQVRKLQQFQDSTAVGKSNSSWNRLRDLGVRFPYGITYANQARTRVIDTLATRSESNDETYALDMEFLRHLRNYQIDGRYWTKERKDWIRLLNVQMCTSDERLLSNDFDPDQRVHVVLPVLPGYHQYSAYGRLASLTGYASKFDKTIYGGLSKYGRSWGIRGDAEKVLIEASKAVSLSNTIAGRELILELICDAVNIPMSQRDNFKAAVNDFGNAGYILGYNSIFTNANHFAIPASIDAYVRLFTMDDYYFNAKTCNSLNRLLQRDLIMSLVYYFNSYKFLLKYSISTGITLKRISM